MIKDLIYSIIYCITESFTISGNGHINILKEIFGDTLSFYRYLPFMAIGFISAIVFALYKDILNIFKETLAIIVKLFLNFFGKKSRKKIRILSNAYSYYSISMLSLLLGLLPLHIFITSEIKTLKQLPDFSTTGFLISAFFMTVVCFYDYEKHDAKKLNFILCFLLGVISAFAVMPGLSPVIIIFCGLILLGTGADFSYKFAMITDIILIIIHIVSVMLTENAVILFNIKSIVISILCFIFTYFAIIVFYTLCKKKKLIFIDIYLIAAGIVISIFI
jgi:undecaprenyl pyrophosphate phosphatase UppP